MDCTSTKRGRGLLVILLLVVALSGCKRKGEGQDAEPPVMPKPDPAQVEVLVEDLNYPLGLAMDEQHIYFGDGPVLKRFPRAGGQLEEVCKVDAIRIGSVALAGDQIFFGASGGGVFRTPKAGGEPVLIAAASNPVCLSLDPTHVWFWSGRVGKVARNAAGGVEPPTHWSAGYTGCLAVDSEHVYYHDDRTLYRRPKAGGKPAVVAETGHLGTAMGLDEHHLYFGDGILDAIVRIPKAGGPAEFVSSRVGIGGRFALGERWLVLAEIGSELSLVDKASLKTARLTYRGLPGSNHDGVAVAVDGTFLAVAANESYWKSGGQPVHIDLTQPDPKVPEVVYTGSVGRAIVDQSKLEWQAPEKRVRLSTVYFEAGKDVPQSIRNATHFVRWNHGSLTASVRSGDLPLVLVAPVPAGREALARKRVAKVEAYLNQELGSGVRTQVEIPQADRDVISIEVPPGAYAALFDLRPEAERVAKEAPRLGPGPACDDLVDSKDCPAGKRCCPLPPGQYEMPLCLPNCAGKPETFCKELLGGIAECNSEAGCCHFPKVLRR